MQREEVYISPIPINLPYVLARFQYFDHNGRAQVFCLVCACEFVSVRGFVLATHMREDVTTHAVLRLLEPRGRTSSNYPSLRVWLDWHHTF